MTFRIGAVFVEYVFKLHGMTTFIASGSDKVFVSGFSTELFFL